jgi:hypothetical protein
MALRFHVFAFHFLRIIMMAAAGRKAAKAMVNGQIGQNLLASTGFGMAVGVGVGVGVGSAGIGVGVRVWVGMGVCVGVGVGVGLRPV